MLLETAEEDLDEEDAKRIAALEAEQAQENPVLSEPFVPAFEEEIIVETTEDHRVGRRARRG